MNLLNRVLTVIADRLHPDADDQARAAGLTVTYRPDGTREVHHPWLPAIAASYRARTLANPDTADLAMLNPATAAVARREAAHRAVRPTGHPVPTRF